MQLITTNMYSSLYNMLTWPNEISTATEVCKESLGIDVYKEIGNEEKQKFNVCLYKYFELNKCFYKKKD